MKLTLSGNESPDWTRMDGYLMVGAMLLGAILRFVPYAQEPLWIDELMSYWFATRPLDELWRDVPRYENHPSLYYTLLKGWIGMFGDAPFALRAMSAAAAVLTIPVVYGLTRTVSPVRPRVAGLVAASLCIVWPTLVYYAQEARPYALMTLAVGCALWGAAWFVVVPARLKHSLVDKEARLAATAVIGGLALTLWLHTTGILFAAILGLVVIAALLAVPSPKGAAIRNTLLMATIVAVLYLPFLPHLLHQTTGLNKTGFWLPTPTPDFLWHTMVRLFGGTHEHGALVAVTVMGLGALGALGLVRAGRAMAALLLVCTAALPVVLQTIISLVSTPILMPRTLIYVAIPAASLVGVFIAGLRAGRVQVLFTVSAFALLSSSSWHLAQETQKEPWPAVGEYLVARVAPEDTVLTVPNFLTTGVDYYAKRMGHSFERLHGLPADFPAPGMDREYVTGFRAAPALSADDAKTVLKLVGDSPSVWVVVRRSSRPYDPGNQVKKALESTYFLSSTKSLADGDIVIDGYRRRD